MADLDVIQMIKELEDRKRGVGQSMESRSGISRPELTSLIDKNTGKLLSQYQLQARPDVGFNYNRTALDELTNRGMSKGPSAYSNILMDKQRLGEEDALTRSARESAGASSYGFGQAAARGGLSSGARERLGAGAANQLSLARQGVLRQGMGERLGISAGDEAQKLDILKSLPGMELGVTQGKTNLDLANRAYGTDVDRLNIMGALGEVGRQDSNKLKEYEEKMKVYGAEKTAQAQENAGKK